MDIHLFFKSVLDQDRASIVLCDLAHTVVYLNPAAEKLHGKALLGKNLLDCHNARSQELIRRSVEWFGKSRSNNILYESYNEKENKDNYIVALRDGDGVLIGYYEKHEYRDRETGKPVSVQYSSIG